MDRLKLPVNELARVCAGSGDAASGRSFCAGARPSPPWLRPAFRGCGWESATPSVVDEIVQEVFLKLCDQQRRILREFKPRGEDSFLGLVRIVSASVANDYFRRQHSTKRGGKVVTIALEDGTGANVPPGPNDSAEMQRLCFSQSLTAEYAPRPS